jgi:2,4-dienoyl-CoA reductase-like NADH-dependent reductase (Old Yellow Enzyme family)
VSSGEGPLLHAPLRIGSCLVRNRLYRAPVLEGAGSGEGAAEIYAEAFEANAKAGVGLIIQGNSCISEDGRSSPGMTLVDTRERMLDLAPVPEAVHRWGGRVFIQIGNAGIYAMEGWHRTYAKTRTRPLPAVSQPPLVTRVALQGTPVKVMTTDEVHESAEQFGRVAEWAREAGYDGVQLASANGKLIHQFLSPYYNRRRDEFGGSVRNRARILELIAESVRKHAGEDYPISVKITVEEDAPRFSPRHRFDEGLELCRLAESFGYHAITPVGLSVLPHASLCRGGDPTSILAVDSIRRRFEEALGGSKVKMAVLRWGYRTGAKQYPFEPVWNRRYFEAAKEAVSIPVFAVGGIRTLDEINQILDGRQADMVGIGRPFYAEPDLPQRLLAGDLADALCENSNRCVPPQQLGLKARCYNPVVARKRAARAKG